MNILKKIEQAFNTHQKSTLENVYVPKIEKTIIPEKNTFNEVYENARNEMNKIYNVKK